MDSLVVTKAVSLTPIVVFIEISVGIITFTNDQPHFRLLPAPRLRSQQGTNAIQFLSHIPHPTNTSQLHYQKQVPFTIVTAATKTSVAMKSSIPEYAFITWSLSLPYVSAGTGVALLFLASRKKGNFSLERSCCIGSTSSERTSPRGESKTPTKNNKKESRTSLSRFDRTVKAKNK